MSDERLDMASGAMRVGGAVCSMQRTGVECDGAGDRPEPLARMLAELQELLAQFRAEIETLRSMGLPPAPATQGGTPTAAAGPTIPANALRHSR